MSTSSIVAGGSSDGDWLDPFTRRLVDLLNTDVKVTEALAFLRTDEERHELVVDLKQSEEPRDRVRHRATAIAVLAASTHEVEVILEANLPSHDGYVWSAARTMSLADRDATIVLAFVAQDAEVSRAAGNDLERHAFTDPECCRIVGLL